MNLKHLTLILPCVGASLLHAQTANPDDADIFELSPFAVESTRDSYSATNSLTGTKFAAAIKDIPFNLQVVTEQLIGDMKVADLHEALKFSVGVQSNVDNLGGYGKFNVRGIQQTYSLRDGIRRYGPNDTASAARVEVLKGPASLFYGHVYPGGVVNVISKRPLEVRHFSVEQTYGSYGSYRSQIDFGDKLFDTLSFRVVGSNDHNDSFVNYNERDSWTIVPSLLWRPTKWMDVLVEYEKGVRNETAPQVGLFVLNLEDYNRVKANPADPFPIPNISQATGTARSKLFFDEFRIKSGTVIDPTIISFIPEDQYFVYEGPYSDQFRTLPVNAIHPDLPRNFNINGPDTFRDFDFETITATVNLKFTDWLRMRALGGYYTNDIDSYATPVNAMRRSGVDALIYYFNGLLRNEVLNLQTEFVVDIKTGFGNHKLLIGADYVSDEFSDFSRAVPRNAITNQNQNYVRLPLETGLSYQWAPWFQFRETIIDWTPEAWGPAGELNSAPTRALETESEGYYLTDSIEFMNGDLMVIAGLRHDRFSQTDLITLNEAKIDNTLVQGGFVYKLTPAIGLFGSYTESFRYNDLAQYPSPDGAIQRGDLPPAMTGDGLEGGLKLDALNGRLSGIVTYFHTTQANIKSTTRINGELFTVMSGEYTSKGLEIEMNYAPLPNWQILIGYAYIDATQTKASPGSILRVGDKWPNVPEHQASFFNRYDFTEGKLKGLYVGGGIRYMGSRRGGSDGNLDQLWDLTSPSYTVTDVFLGYKLQLNRHTITLSLNVDNLFDKEYLQGGQTIPSEPRRYTVALRYDF